MNKMIEAASKPNSFFVKEALLGLNYIKPNSTKRAEQKDTNDNHNDNSGEKPVLKFGPMTKLKPRDTGTTNYDPSVTYESSTTRHKMIMDAIRPISRRTTEGVLFERAKRFEKAYLDAANSGNLDNVKSAVHAEVEKDYLGNKTPGIEEYKERIAEAATGAIRYHAIENGIFFKPPTMSTKTKT